MAKTQFLYQSISLIKYFGTIYKINKDKVFSEIEIKEFEPRFKSAKTRFKLSAGLNLETFDTILSGTNHI